MLFPVIAVWGQHMQNYTTKDGLPSNEVYDLTQDDDGYMWFATDAGVSRFNGSEFENFTIEDGLPDQVIFEVYKDDVGVVWVAGMNRNLAYFERERFYEYQFNDSIQAYAEPNALILDLFVTKGSVQMTFARAGGALEIDQKGNVRSSYLEGEQEVNNYNAELFILEEASLTMVSDRIVETISLRGKKTWIFDSIGESPLYVSSLIEYKPAGAKKGVGSAVKLGDLVLFGGLGAKVLCYSLSQNELIEIVDSLDTDRKGIYKMVAKSESEFFAITAGSDLGILVCQLDNMTLSETDQLLSGIQCNDIFIDALGGTWVVTYKHGVFHSNKLGLKIHDLGGRGVFSVDVDKNDILINTDDYNGLIRNGQGEFVPFIQSDNILKQSWFSRLYEDSLIIFHDFSRLCLLNRNTQEKKTYNGYVGQRIQLFDQVQGGDLFYSAYQSELLLCNRDKEIAHTYYHGPTIRCLLELGDSLFFGTPKGLLTGKSITEPDTWREVPELAFDIRKLYTHAEGLLVGTKAHGLYILGDTLLEFTMSDGFPSNEITGIASWQDRIYVGTDKGIVVLTVQNGVFALRQVINTGNGLVSEDITDLNIHDDRLWIGSKFGLQSIETDFAFQPAAIPTVLFMSLKTGETTVEQPRGTIRLSYGEGPLSIHYTGVDVSERQRFLYEYKWGRNGAPFITKASEILIPELPHGLNELFVRAKNVHGMWSEEISLTIDVKEPFWLSGAFLVTSIGCALSLFILFFWLRERKIREEVALENKMNTLRAKAIRAQMNPHFIFNCLNSIQGYILAQDTKKSINYLGRFAGLVRHVLDSTEKTEVSIKTEIENLRAYLDIEQMRFEHRFEYAIELSPGMDAQLKIPTMLIQPYVENSIWHGLQTTEQGGRILITFKANGTYLFAHIIDNGIGRGRAKVNKDKERRSVGMTLTEERLKLVKGEGRGEVRIEDLFDENGPAGTKVELRIPLEEMNGSR